MNYKLPPLPDLGPERTPHWTKVVHEKMQAYAIAAIEAQGVPDALREEAMNLASILSGMVEGGYSDLETLYTEAQADGDAFVKRAAEVLEMLASAPPAPHDEPDLPSDIETDCEPAPQEVVEHQSPESLGDSDKKEQPHKAAGSGLVQSLTTSQESVGGLRELYGDAYGETPPAPQAVVVQQEAATAWQSIEAVAAQRYKVGLAHDSMFYRHAVVAGDGSQQIYIGRKTECENMARKFAGAFLDGAYLANLYTHPAPQQIGQGVPDGWQLVRTDALKMAIDFAVPAMERDRDSPSNSAWMVEAADRNINAVRAMLASAPPAPQQKPPTESRRNDHADRSTTNCIATKSYAKR